MLDTVRNIISSDATTQEMIAPVIDTLVATKAWSVGEEFIYAGTLYKVTTAIAVGDTIVVSGSSANCELADTVTEQIVSMREGVKYLYSSLLSGSVNPNSVFIVTIPTPTNATKIHAIIPVAIVPNDTWAGVYSLICTNVDLSARQIRYYAYGTGNAHVYIVRYLVIYE